MHPQISVWTIIAAIAAIISAFSAFKSRGTAKRAYELSQRIYNDRQSNFDLYLIDSYRWIISDDPLKKLLLFHVTLNNKSDSKSSFKADLEIEYVRPDQSVARVLFKHNDELKKIIPSGQYEMFPNDIRVEEKAMVSKWLIFDQSDSTFKGYRIEKYKIKVSDTTGNFQIVESSIIKELSYV